MTKINLMFVDTDSLLQIEEWLGGGGVAELDKGYIVVGTVTGNVLATPGDLILKFDTGNVVFTPKLSI